METESPSNTLDRVDQIARQADKYVTDLKNFLKGKKVTAKVQELMNTFDARYSDYINALESGADYDRVTKSASHLSVYLSAISNGLKNSSSADDNLREMTSRLSSLSKSLKECIEDREVTFSGSDRKEIEDNSKRSLPDTQVLRKNIEILQGQLQDSEDRHEKRQLTLSKRLEDIQSSIDTIEEDVQSRLEAVDALYSGAKEELEKKQKGVDDLLGTISASVIAGDYDTSATSEKKMADWLRAGSLGCMVIIAVIVGLSLYETTTDAFKWENSLFRLVFTFLLTIPAAYLARESAKHRQQQYAHLQTSLDLKAITPYLASLPIEEQHRLKSEIANRLFAPKDYSSDANDAYPINSQEILMKLLDKLEFKSSSRGDAGTDKHG
ncbi:hypothetical protein [Oceanospirillum linum]|uniref:Uncharacterized protein n=1 Tax=Oceanospirillum linum TaxID=966 RepID=A0A1T1HE73_OCELI|nr:hypothetical protein [Oceanospirillum linum]OOV88161.1 hypothetical protein BTA35_0201040 [Oceanospirillum linum]SEF45537.1 hypothetical protein SAMN04489856_101214 [Oleiphilus messinensis]SMP01799.1 hypothetical protein SAMN06264348_101215 [Oceanospirillum linum]